MNKSISPNGTIFCFYLIFRTQILRDTKGAVFCKYMKKYKFPVLKEYCTLDKRILAGIGLDRQTNNPSESFNSVLKSEIQVDRATPYHILTTLLIQKMQNQSVEFFEGYTRQNSDKTLKSKVTSTQCDQIVKLILASSKTVAQRIQFLEWSKKYSRQVQQINYPKPLAVLCGITQLEATTLDQTTKIILGTPGSIEFDDTKQRAIISHNDMKSKVYGKNNWNELHCSCSVS